MKYYLYKYIDTINYVNKVINNYNLPYLKIAKYLNISVRNLKRILTNNINYTYVNPILILEQVLNIKEIFDKQIFIKENNEKNITNLLDIPNIKYSNKEIFYIKHILFSIGFFNEIFDFNDYFKYLLYLTDDEKRKQFTKTLSKLKKFKIIKIVKNKIIKGKNYYKFEISKRAEKLNINLSYKYFFDHDNFYNCFLCAIYMDNNKKREASLIEYLFDLYTGKNPEQLIYFLNNYFSWLKNNGKRKSNIFKIAYISVLLRFYTDRSMLLHVFLFALHFIKNVPIKNHLLSNKINLNFDFNIIYEYDKIIGCKFKTIAYFIKNAFLSIVNMFFHFNFFSTAIVLNNYLLRIVPSDDIHYTYFYNLNFLLITYFGNIKKLNELINNIKVDDDDTIFKLKHFYKILTNKQIELKKLEQNFLHITQNKNYHVTYLNNILENKIINYIVEKDYKKAFCLALFYSEYRKKSNINEAFNYIIVIFILNFKNHKNNVLFSELDILNCLKDEKFKEIFHYEIKLENISLLKDDFNNKSKIYFFNLILTLFNIINKSFISLKRNYIGEQNNLNNNKINILNSMEEKLKQDGITRKNIDIVSTFINKYPEDNEILKLFHQEDSKEDVFNNFIFIQEFNFLVHFMDKMIKDFCKFENYNIQNLMYKKEFLLCLDKKIIKKMIESNFDFHVYITNYFENYLLELEQKRIEIQSSIDSTEQGKNINMTEQLMSLFNNDVNDRFLRFTKAYILAKY